MNWNLPTDWDLGTSSMLFFFPFFHDNFPFPFFILFFLFSSLVIFVYWFWLVLVEQGFVMDKIDDLSAADRQDEGFLKTVPSVPSRRLFSSFILASETRICRVL